MKAWLTSYEDYNSGRLIGEWINIDDFYGVDDLQEMIDEYLEKRRKATGLIHDEWGFFDYDECPNPSHLGENPDLEYVIELNEAIEKHGFDMIKSALACDIPLEKIEDAYWGEWDSRAQFAEEFHDNCGDLTNVPTWIISHIDWDSVGRELMYDFQEEDGHYWSSNY